MMSHKYSEDTNHFQKIEKIGKKIFFARMKFPKFDKVKYFRSTDFYEFIKN